MTMKNMGKPVVRENYIFQQNNACIRSAATVW